jgi:hypothetical protein
MEARYKEILTAGKVRPLVIFDYETEFLAPLHSTMYNYITSMPWMLRGSPSRKRVSALKGPWFTSVDLVAATDGLYPEVTEAILGAAFSKAVHVPGAVRMLAYRSLYPEVVNVERQQVSHGQMMGGYLSFPLLCLQSYCAAQWASRDCGGNGFLINGDDCVISASRPIEQGDYPPGFVLNDAKTIRSQNVVDVNSTVFLKQGRGRWREVRHLRRGGFLTDFPGMLHIVSAVTGSTAWTNALIRSRVGKKWGFLPSQLGLSFRSYVAFERERQMVIGGRRHTPLPDGPLQGTDPSLLAVRGRLGPDAHWATTEHIFNTGRWGGMKRDVFSPTVGEIRRTYSWGNRRPWRLTTYLGGLRSLACTGGLGRHRSLQFVPEWYTTMEEDEGSRGLRFFEIPVLD